MNIKNSQKKLKIMHLSTSSIWDMGQGKGRLSTYLPLKAMLEKGHELIFLTSDPEQSGNLSNFIETRNIKFNIHERREKFWDSILFYIKFPFFISSYFIQSFFIGLRFNPDIIYAHEIYVAIPAFLLSKVFNSKYIFRSYGIGDIKSVHRRFLLLTLKIPAQLYIITDDGTLGNVIAKKYKLPNDKVCFWVNGFDDDWIKKKYNYQSKEELISKEQKIVLSVCRLVPSKQVDILINAIPKVLEYYKSVKFIIIGDGCERYKLENIANTLGINNFVSFLGAIEHSYAIKYIKSCDLFISMNSLSSISNPVLEAMTCGKAVLALNAGETSKLVKNNYNGILINKNDLHKLPEYIVSLLTDDEIRQKIGKNAQNFIMTKWPSWKQRTHLEILLIETLCLENSRNLIKLKRNIDCILNPLEHN